MILNLRAHNTTVDGAGLTPLPAASAPERGSVDYRFRLPAADDLRRGRGRGARIRRLMANGSDAITGITWDGWSYNYDLDGGRPVRLGNVTAGERAVVGEDGVLTVRVADASAALLELEGCDDDGSFDRDEGAARRRKGRFWW